MLIMHCQASIYVYLEIYECDEFNKFMNEKIACIFKFIKIQIDF